MVVIDYINKTEREISTETIKAKVFEYEITEADLHKCVNNLPEDYDLNWIFLNKDNNIYELIVDNIADGRIIEGGIKDNKAFLEYYIVEKGLDELLIALSLH